MTEFQKENGGVPALQGKKIKRETIQNWTGVAFSTVTARLNTLGHLIEDHRRTIESLIGRFCPEISSRCDDLQQLQRQIDGYFLVLDGDASSLDEQALIAAEQKEYGLIMKRIQNIFFSDADVLQIPASATIETAERPSIFLVQTFRELWQKNLEGKLTAIHIANSKKDYPYGIGNELIEGFEDMWVDLPSKDIDNSVYIEHFREKAEELLDSIDERVAAYESTNNKIFDCFDLYAQGKRSALKKAVNSLTETECEILEQLLHANSDRDPESLQYISKNAREAVVEGTAKLKALIEELRNGTMNLLAELETSLLVYNLQSRSDITEPMVWRSEFVEQMKEEIDEREQKDSKELWFANDRLKGDVLQKWQRFSKSKHVKRYEKAESECMREVRGVLQRVPTLISKKDLEGLQSSLEIIAQRYHALIQQNVTPHAGKSVAKVLSDRFNVICKGVGHKGDLLLLATDIGRNSPDIDRQILIQRTDPLTPEDIEQIFVLYMSRIHRVHAEEYAKFGRRSESKKLSKAFEMMVRFCMRELPPKIYSIEQLFSLLCVPLATRDAALEHFRRVRLNKLGTADGMGQKLDDLSEVVCARGFYDFAEVIRKRTWNVRRHLSSQGTVLTEQDEQPAAREGKYGLITKESALEELDEHLRTYQLQNRSTSLLAKLEPDLQDKLIESRDTAAARIGGFFEEQGNQISHDELLVLKTRIIEECDQLRRSIPTIEARDYIDLFEESYRCVIWYIENAMDFGARVLGWDKQHDLMAAVQGAEGKLAMTGPQEREFDLADFSSPSVSTSLHVPMPTGFEEALGKYPINNGVIAREVRRAFSTLEKELPLVLGFGHVDRAARLTPLLMQCRDISLSTVEASGETINSIEVFDQLFQRLGWIFDQIQNRFKGVMYGFLTQRFIALRKRMQEQTLQRVTQEEMQQTLSTMNDVRINAGQYETFFIQLAQNILIDRCRQFLYSCISPGMSTEQVGQIGAAINKAVQTVVAFLTDRIRMRCSQTRGPISLAELRQCFAEIAQIDITTLGLPGGTEERFRVQVLLYLESEINKQQTPAAFFTKYPLSEFSTETETTIENEVTTVLRSRENEELIALQYRAHTTYAETREILHSIEAVLGLLQSQEQHRSQIEEFTLALQTLRTSLYSEFSTNIETSNRSSVVQSLQEIAAVIYQQSQDSTHPDTQRTAAYALIHLSVTLIALSNSLPSPDDGNDNL